MAVLQNEAKLFVKLIVTRGWPLPSPTGARIASCFTGEDAAHFVAAAAPGSEEEQGDLVSEETGA